MTDSHTRMKLWPQGYSATVPRQYANHQFLQLKKYYLSSEPNPVHCCVKKSTKTREDNDWLVFLLSFGLEQTLVNQNQMTDLKNGNVFLRHAKLEEINGKFSYPKSCCTTKDNTIIVADTANNRVVGFNTGGVQNFLFDKYNFRGEMCSLFSPLSVCRLNNGNIAVCNYGSSLINVITLRGNSRLMFPCSSKPIYIDTDYSGSMFVLTESGEIEEFSKSGKIIKVTKIMNTSATLYTIMAVASFSDEIFLGKCNSTELLIITKTGEMLRYITLNIPGSGLNIFLSNLVLEDHGLLLVADSVNRSIHMFNSINGQYKTTLINGKSGLGCVQALSLTKDNHLVTTEYALNQIHSVKIFSCTYDFNK